ncbi:hypothetical protein Tco_1378217, partial [Tanacetum coccineum]
VLTRTGLHRPNVRTAKPICTARPSVSTARPVCTARTSVCIVRPSVSTARPVYATRPVYPRMDNDHVVVDSGCSSHMTSNKAYLSDYEDYNRGFVAFGSDPKGVEDVDPAAHEKSSKSSPKDNDVQDSEDVDDKEGQHQITKDEQVLHNDLEKMIAQEVVATALDDATRQDFKEEMRNIASQKREA